MRPFDIEPNYKEDLNRSKAILRNRRDRSGSPMRGDDIETTSEFMKKTINDKDQGGFNKSIIVSASPFRAVLRRGNNGSEYMKDEDDSS